MTSGIEIVQVGNRYGALRRTMPIEEQVLELIWRNTLSFVTVAVRSRPDFLALSRFAKEEI